MKLQDRIIAYVTACNSLVSLEKLVDKGKSAGFSESEVLATLSDIGKKLKATVRGGQVYYQIPSAPKPKLPTDHLRWVRENYPPMDETNDGSGIEADYSFLFLSPEELDQYKAEVRGVTYIPKKRYAKKGV